MIKAGSGTLFPPRHIVIVRMIPTIISEKREYNVPVPISVSVPAVFTPAPLSASAALSADAARAARQTADGTAAPAASPAALRLPYDRFCTISGHAAHARRAADAQRRLYRGRLYAAAVSARRAQRMAGHAVRRHAAARAVLSAPGQPRRGRTLAAARVCRTATQSETVGACGGIL